MIKACVVCGGEFEVRGKTCSENCRTERRRESQRVLKSHKKCIVCAKNFEAASMAHKACSDECRVKNRKQRSSEYLARWKIKNHERVCEIKRESHHRNKYKNREKVCERDRKRRREATAALQTIKQLEPILDRLTTTGIQL